jgi:hypothetical protein
MRIALTMIAPKKHAASSSLNSSMLLLSIWSFGRRPGALSFAAALGNQSKATMFTKHFLRFKKISKGLLVDVPLAAKLMSCDAMLSRQASDVVAAVAAFRRKFARRNVADAADINVIQGPRKGLIRQVIVFHQNTALDTGNLTSKPAPRRRFRQVSIWGVSVSIPCSV